MVRRHKQRRRHDTSTTNPPTIGFAALPSDVVYLIVATLLPFQCYRSSAMTALRSGRLVHSSDSRYTTEYSALPMYPRFCLTIPQDETRNPTGNAREKVHGDISFCRHATGGVWNVTQTIVQRPPLDDDGAEPRKAITTRITTGIELHPIHLAKPGRQYCQIRYDESREACLVICVDGSLSTIQLRLCRSKSEALDMQWDRSCVMFRLHKSHDLLACLHNRI